MLLALGFGWHECLQLFLKCCLALNLQHLLVGCLLATRTRWLALQNPRGNSLDTRSGTLCLKYLPAFCFEHFLPQKTHLMVTWLSCSFGHGVYWLGDGSITIWGAVQELWRCGTDGCGQWACWVGWWFCDPISLLHYSFHTQVPCTPTEVIKAKYLSLCHCASILRSPKPDLSS